ncbi:MAG: SUMF1/EgtB/PvdO family nonheme iron enzyme [Thiolinea sp.]
MTKVFISYARDGSHGERLAAEAQQQLLAAGFEVFRDVIGLKPGDVWYHKLEFELESSDVMVLVVSEKVRTSKWVHNEVSMAEEIGIPVIPVLAERIQRQPLWLRHLQLLDFCEQQAWAVLLDVLGVQHPQPNPSPSKGEGLSQKTAVPPSPSGCGGRGVREPPAWAADSGDDQYGHYADLNYQGIIQRFRWIKPGTFLMGSPPDEPERYGDETQHQVTLSKGFWLADTTVTQALWESVMGNNPSHFKGNPTKWPVERISWNDCQEFIRKLNQQANNLSVNLPSEAEWEYACRASTETPYYFGNIIVPHQANVGQEIGKTVAVKSYPANAWGLYDMHGNVWEWCQDSYAEYSSDKLIDPQGQQDGKLRVLRGGSWGDISRNCRSAIRSRESADGSNRGYGFRLALSHWSTI